MENAGDRAEMIRTAIDSYPGGICIASNSGRVILVNLKLNELYEKLTGHLVVNVLASWKELKQFEHNDTCERLVQPWITEGMKDTDDDQAERLFFSIDGSEIWRFRMQWLNENMIQIDAAEITKLYRHSEEVYKNNIRLRQMQYRQKALLKNIVAINENKEILSAKMRIHDEFGERIIETWKIVSDDQLKTSGRLLKERWKRTLQEFSNIPMVRSDRHTAMRNELMQVSEMIGCRIVMTGDEPEDETAQRLLYAAIRESLSNAVEHAHASELYVMIESKRGYYRAEISDNGNAQNPESISEDNSHAISEGNGLTALRSRLEQEGASMQIVQRGGIILVIEIPVPMEID